MADPGAVLLVGGGGLIGRHLHAALARGGWSVIVPDIPWAAECASIAALSEAIAGLVERAGKSSWTVLWAAGAGVVATSEADLATELRVFETALTALPGAGSEGADRRGALVLVSSAGGVHAGSAGPPFSEQTLPVPLVAYGRTKLAMEQAAATRAAEAGLPLLVIRPANVYGPGQRLTKPQGLISQLALAQVSRAPLPVHVSSDTMRDYVYAPDLAALIVAAVDRLHDQRPTDPVTKIAATGTPVTIAHLIGEARRVMRHPVRTVTVAGRSGGQVADLRFRSIVWRDLDEHLRTPLVVGLAATAIDVASRLARGGDLDS